MPIDCKWEQLMRKEHLSCNIYWWLNRKQMTWMVMSPHNGSCYRVVLSCTRPISFGRCECGTQDYLPHPELPSILLWYETTMIWAIGEFVLQWCAVAIVSVSKHSYSIHKTDCIELPSLDIYLYSFICYNSNAKLLEKHSSLVLDPGGSMFKTCYAWYFSEAFFVPRPGNRYMALSRPCVGSKGGEEEQWYSVSVSPLLV